MKKMTSIICSITFMISGYLIATTNNAFGVLNDAKSIHAAEAPMVHMQMPKDLFLTHTNNVGPTMYPDTIHDTIPLEVRHDTIVKYKTKWKTKVEIKPDTTPSQPKIDTVYISNPTIVIPIKEEVNQVDSLQTKRDSL